MPFVIGVLLGCGDTGARRLPESGFQVAFESHNVASDIKSGKTVSADITVELSWQASGRYGSALMVREMRSGFNSWMLLDEDCPRS
jgi:hypothetical protein